MKKKTKKLLTILSVGVMAFSLFTASGLISYDSLANKNVSATEKTFFSAVKNAEIIENYHAPEHIGNHTGIFIKAPDNGDSVVELDYELDLRAFSKDDVLFKFIPVTTQPIDSVEHTEIDELTITLTDVQDEESYLTINVIANEYGAQADKYGGKYPYCSYVKAGGDGQILSGYQCNPNTYAISVGQSKYYGKDAWVNFFGKTRSFKTVSEDVRALSLMYDYNLQQVHLSKPMYDTVKGTLVADLTKSDEMKGEWDGFTSGKVRMRITAQSSTYNNKNAGFIILQVGELDFSETAWQDKNAPKLSVDTQGYDVADLPNGQVFTKYPVFGASAYDVFDSSYGNGGEKDVAAKVICLADNSELPIIDGYFVPKQVGKYAVVYETEKDVAGHSSTKTLYVDVLDVFDGISHTWQTPFVSSGIVGEKAYIPQGEVNGALGTYEKTMRVFCVSDGEELEIFNDTFVPQKQGWYCVRVDVKDFLSREKTFEYYYEAKVSIKPVWATKPSLPAVTFVGKETLLPDFEAYDYYSLQGNRVAAQKSYQIFDAENNLLKTLKAGESFVPDATYGDEITVVCTVKSLLFNEQDSFSAKMKILNRQQKLSMGEYFNVQNASVAYNHITGRNVSFLFDNDGANVTFGNTVLLQGFQMEFAIPSELNAYESVTFTLTDWQNANKQVALTLQKGGEEKSEFFINGKAVENITGDFFGKKIVMSINEHNEVIDQIGTALGVIDCYATGETFTGFANNLCYMQITVGGVSGNGALQISKLGNHFMSNSTADAIAPQISLIGSLQKEQYVGMVRLPSAVATDVFYGKTDVSVSVENPNGNIVYDGAITDEEISFFAGITGAYEITYKAKDDKNNLGTNYCTLYVYSTEQPNVTLDGEMPKTAMVGNTVSLPAPIFNGNLYNLSVIIYVVCPNGSVKEVTETLQFTAEKAGLYEINYYIVDDMDGSYNYQLLTYQIVVG